MVNTVCDVLRVISDSNALALFEAIENNNNDSNNKDCTTKLLLTKTQLTRKQYYSSLSEFIKIGLIKRTNGIYSLTTIGKIIYDAKTQLDSCINDYWKFQIIDQLEKTSSKDNSLPKEEFTSVINALVSDSKMRDIIMSQIKRQ
ncbi:MAG: hypothetical protein QN423_05445 [Nitrososphaeraceae archaeon]|jgi:hypothetical protein|nr:hypothetical protein [Nitrososphaeraceae archaeon]